jgi:hypothetical protein
MNVSTSYSSQAKHCLFIAEDGTLWTWGRNLQGSLGLGHAERACTPEQLLLPKIEGCSQEVLSFSSGSYHNLLVTKSHHLFVWGCNNNSQLGINDEQVQHNRPVLVPFPDNEKPVRVCCGSDFSTAISASGKLYAWGRGNEIGLGAPDAVARVPTQVKFGPDAPCHVVVDVACGMAHALAITQDGKVYGWGENPRSQVVGELPSLATPTLIPLPGEICRVFAGSQRSFALTKNGELLAWGGNDYGALGLGKEKKIVLVPEILLPKGVRTVALGWGHGLALMEDSSVVIWGVADDGELGYGGDDDLYSPEILKTLPADKKVAGIFSGFCHTFFILEDGTLLACGEGADGVLGIGTFRDQLLPVEVTGFKVRVPRDHETEWREIFFWLFLGNSDKKSIIHILPVEVLFQFTFVRNF